jgi:hypothetical protein
MIVDDPIHDRIETVDGRLVGRQAILREIADVLQSEVTYLAATIPESSHRHRAHALIAWVDQLAEVAAMPVHPLTDYRGRCTPKGRVRSAMGS